jgi:acetolactate synthase-1/2/3 large subunit
MKKAPRFMADGYARVSGRLGVCCATTGPGATNALTGIACAYRDSVPVLLVTAQVALSAFGKGAAQESSPLGIDIVDMFRDVTKASVMLMTAGKNCGPHPTPCCGPVFPGARAPSI